tara:strand:+ start:252 stop:935 length:684 start_codon:yes stop_codon:yes gene_type:complete
MWALINNDNSIAEIIRFPRNITINDVQHSRRIFTAWSWAELNAIGIYQVIDNGQKGNDKFEYTSQPTYTFNADDNNVTTSYTITEKVLDDVNEVWSQEEIDAGQAPDGTSANDPKLDIEGNQIVTKGLKTLAKEQAKKTAHTLIKRFGWLVQRVTMDSNATIPSAVTTYCAAIRTDCGDICTAIDNASNMTEFKALYADTVNSEGVVTQVNRINRWTTDSTVTDYIR